jgi:hypothetical protein
MTFSPWQSETKQIEKTSPFEWHSLRPRSKVRSPTQVLGGLGRCLLRAVMLFSRPQWNDRLRLDSSPSRGDSVGALSAQPRCPSPRSTMSASRRLLPSLRANSGRSATAWRTRPNRPECGQGAPDRASDGHSDLKRWSCAIDAEPPRQGAAKIPSGIPV